MLISLCSIMESRSPTVRSSTSCRRFCRRCGQRSSLQYRVFTRRSICRWNRRLTAWRSEQCIAGRFRWAGAPIRRFSRAGRQNHPLGSWPTNCVFESARANGWPGCEIFVSGGAPLGFELATWYADIGIRIHEGYGLTETSPVIAINNPHAHKIGHCGPSASNVEVRIAEDSEILVRGPSVFRCLLEPSRRNPGRLCRRLVQNRRHRRIDDDGFLSVTDRKKDLLKTSGGKFIAPQPVENSLKLNALIGTAVVVGDRRKFASVLISPHFPLLEEWARDQSCSYSSARVAGDSSRR